jgi:hypothetical protein
VTSAVVRRQAWSIGPLRRVGWHARGVCPHARVRGATACPGGNTARTRLSSCCRITWPIDCI